MVSLERCSYFMSSGESRVQDSLQLCRVPWSSWDTDPPSRFVVQINIDMLEGLCRRGVQMKIRSQKGAKGSSEGHPEEEEV